jgi:hypothetical protein
LHSTLGQAGAQNSHSPVDAGLGGDGTIMFSQVPQLLVNIAHIQKN